MRSSSYHRAGRSGLFVLALFIVCIRPAVGGQNTLIRDSIPERYRWNLSEIYPAWDAWQADYDRAGRLIDEYAAHRGSVSHGPTQLLEVLKLADQIGILSDRVYLYASLNHDTDMRDNEVAGRYQMVDNLNTRFDQASAWFEPELLALSPDTVSDWIQENPGLAPYRFAIENLFRQKVHYLDEGQERVLSCFGSYNRSPEAVYWDMSTSDIQFPSFVLSGGDTILLTESQIWLQLRVNRNQDERRRMFDLFYHTYHDYVNTYASIYNSVLQRDWALSQARNYTTALEAALDDDNIPAGVLENLVATARQGAEPLRRYHKLRKEALGLDHYYWSDRTVPVVDFEKTYEYNEVVPWVIEAVAPLGDDYQDRLKAFFEGRWIDVYENEGKYSGGYQDDAYGAHPYVLLNFNGTLGEVFTVAHELGHALHTIYSYESQPYVTSNYTIFVAEVPSTLNEALLLEYLLQRSEDPLERIALLQQAIDNLAGTFYLQVLFADFEWQAHRLVEQGAPITADVLRGIYGRLLEDYFGDAVEIDSLYRSYWTRIGHFFDSPYYVYKYATSYAASARLVEQITSDNDGVRQDALDRYFTLLRSGGNDYPMEQLKKAGVDLSTPDALQAVVDQLDGLVTRLETELAGR